MAGIDSIKLGQPERKSTVDAWFQDELEEACSSWGFGSVEGHFNASTFGTTCDRLLWASFNGRIPKKKLTGKFARLLEHGGTFENRMEKYLTKMGIIKGREVPVSFEEGDFRITGRIDFIIKHINLGLTILELKTINSRGFKALKGKPKPEHIFQVQMYLESRGLDTGLISYENKDDQDVQTFRVKRDKKYWKEQVVRGHSIIAMPEIPEKCGSKYPRYCDCQRAKVS